MLTLLIQLIAGHALADFPLQGEFLANAKNPNTDLGKDKWILCLLYHATIHGVIVTMLTNNPILGLAEITIHFCTDLLKCKSIITFNQDQFIHIGCKILWALMTLR